MQNKEAVSRYNRSAAAKAARIRWHTANPGRRLLQCARSRAKEKGLEFNISLDDCTVPKTCPVLGIPLYQAKGGGPRDNSPTLDRILPNKGYIKGNVKVISSRANTIKNNATIDEVEKVLKYMKDHADNS